MWLLLLAALASAQDEAVTRELPIDVERFRPASDPYGYAVTDSSTTLYNLQVGVGIWGNYSQDSLVMVWDGARVIGPGPSYPDAILDHRSVMDFQLGFGLGDIFSLTADVPVVVWQQGFEPAALSSSDPIADLESSGLGDVRITPKFVLVDIHEGYPIGVALLVRGSVPTGSTRSFLGEGGPTAEPALVLEVADGSIHEREYKVRGAVNAGALIKQPDVFRGVEVGNAVGSCAKQCGHNGGAHQTWLQRIRQRAEGMHNRAPHAMLSIELDHKLWHRDLLQPFRTASISDRPQLLGRTHSH